MTKTTQTANAFEITYTNPSYYTSESIAVAPFKGRFRVTFYGPMALNMAEPMGVHATFPVAVQAAKDFAASLKWTAGV